jgi:dTDP-4-dehydrorhamnose 3,5-epimerase-like enzyme
MSDIKGSPKPHLIPGGIVVDDRGKVQFANEFDFREVKRFYCVQNHREGTIRAWHGHKKEAKYVTVVQGAALVGAVAIDDWNTPSVEAKVHNYVLAPEKPNVLFIPAGYANGFMSLTSDTIMIFFSTASLEESLVDDWRFPARYWDIWEVQER